MTIKRFRTRDNARRYYKNLKYGERKQVIVGGKKLYIKKHPSSASDYSLVFVDVKK